MVEKAPGQTRRAMQSDWQTIPHEIIVCEIFRWLPVRSLLQFRCVCKSWCAAISHLKLTHSTHRLAVFTPSRYNKDFILSIKDSNYRWKKTKYYHPNVDDVLCCYKGILVYLSHKSVFLLNHSTRRHEKQDGLDDADLVFTAGMVHHSPTNAYKILIGMSCSRVRKLRVIDYKTKTWKEFGFRYYRSTFTFPLVVADDNAYWLVDGPPHRMIVCFDTLKDKLITLELPDLNEKQQLITDLMVLDGHLAIGRCCYLDETSRSIEILIMKQYGCWEILFTITNFNGYNPKRELKPFFIKDDDVFIIVRDRHILVYNVTEKSYTRIFSGKKGIKTVVPYVDSVFWPGDVTKVGRERKRRRPDA